MDKDEWKHKRELRNNVYFGYVKESSVKIYRTAGDFSYM